METLSAGSLGARSGAPGDGPVQWDAAGSAFPGWTWRLTRLEVGPEPIRIREAQ